jgi:hypothetical protein
VSSPKSISAEVMPGAVVDHVTMPTVVGADDFT